MLDKKRKNEIIYISVDRLILDKLNPRLAGDPQSNQENIIQYIYDKEELDELAGSLALHGFLPEEPIIVVPVESSDFESINKDNVEDFKFIVIEGNRRISSVKLLLSEKLRATIDVDNNFPKIQDPEVKTNLLSVPAIIYYERKNVDAYLGIRHIAGTRKWDAYAKAKYIYDKVEDCKQNDDIATDAAIDIIKAQIADRKDTIRKLYVYYNIFSIIEREIVKNQSKHIKERFSLLQVALGMGRTPIAKYIGVPPFSNINFNEEIIDAGHLDRLKDLTKWVFGLYDSDPARVISDSRNIGNKLAPILDNTESTEYLEKYGDLAGAYELTDGEEQFVLNSLRKASKAMSRAQSKIYKYKGNKEMEGELNEIKSLMEQIYILLK